MQNVYLTGFMGVGKTTIGQAVAQKLDVSVIDTDFMVESSTNMLIKDIFEKYGENYFRDLETKILTVLPSKDVIVTTGGGIVTRQENMEWMKENGCVIFLYADPEVIWNRLENDTTRPLIQQRKKEEVLGLFGNRLLFYKQAHITLDTTDLSLDEAVEAVHKAIKTWNNRQH
ncbi:shikimate kinase [Sutcliffiella horikoshii]|uniref:Shikimate kinase n=1 Tax=Sutcliffiella horikoshii TaxID=79883 RepID=A0A5D4SXH3_9BACI|nr:shikimate kinase [Sutcliffiella horikoshii]TYS68073.1 shikimate kinase [Sutcliffiella horikoshii]